MDWPPAPKPAQDRAFEFVETPACQRALRCWKSACDDESLDIWAELAAAEPDNLYSLSLAARAYGERFRLEDTERLAEQIRALGPRCAMVHQTIGDIHGSVGFPERAQRDYQTAASCPDAGPDTLLALAACMERARRFDEARSLIERAERGRPAVPQALLLKARIHRQEKEFASADATLANLIGRAPGSSEILVEAVGELALLRDRQGDYDAAFDVIGRAKAIHLGRCQAQRAASDHVTHRFATLVDSVTPDDFARWQADSPVPGGEPRPALLTGFPRSGTTLMEQVLDAHPGIVSSEEKDVIARGVLPAMHDGLTANDPLAAVLDRLTPERIREHRQFYWRVLETFAGEKFGTRTHFDKNPAYNLLIPFFIRLFPEARLLVAVRDPRDILLSCYLRYLPLNPVSVTFLTLESTAHRYALDMTGWLKFSDMISNPWIEVRYEDLVGDLGGEARRICQLLELPWDPELLDYRKKLEGKSIASPTYADVRKPIYRSSIGRWKHYEKHLERQFEVLAPYIDAFGYSP